MQPRIAITTSTAPTGPYRLPHVMLSSPYIRAVEAPGAAALLLTPAHAPDSMERLLDVSHALVLSGGEDIDPALYGEEPHPCLEELNPERDEMELRALEGALARGMPILAICRGAQLLNVAFGGTLYQDLPSQRPGPVVHQQEAAVGSRWHTARAEPGARLTGILGSEELFINSFHHQGVRRLASGLQATVVAEDGLVEGVEAVEHPWVYGVQWHPERHDAHAPREEDDPDRRLFQALVRTAAEWAGQEVG